MRRSALSLILSFPHKLALESLLLWSVCIR